MDSSARLKSKFLGGMVGTALGDAIGELAFATTTEEALRSRIAQQQILVYTDDTAMALGLAQSLVARGEIAPQHLGDTFRRNYRQEPWRGYAPGPPSLFRRVEQEGVTYTEAARQIYGGEGSFGNGASMRIAPVGLFFHDADDLYEQARRSATVTHAHPLGVDGAALLGWTIAQVVDLDPEEDLPREKLAEGLMGFARTETFRTRLQEMVNLLISDVPPREAGRRLGPGVAAHESVPFALYAFLRHYDSFEDCLFCAALNSGDRDTVGAMACAISGAYLGVEALHRTWRAKLENRERIEALALDLWERTTEGSDGR
ncbi:MAG: ADP-ribosylglycohydrolase family protein [Anaerolineae bacterium]